MCHASSEESASPYEGIYIAAGDDVAVPVPVGPLLLELGVGQVGRGDELRRHGARHPALGLRAVARHAEDLEVLTPARDGRLGHLDRVRLLGRAVARFL